MLLAGVGAALLAFFIWKATNDNKTPPTSDNCVGQIQHSMVILVDHSEHATVQTHQEIIARALSRVKQAQPNTLVTLFVVSRTSQEQLQPLFSACRPPEGGNPVVENVKVIRDRYERKFRLPLEKALSKRIEVSEASPLAQAITDISLTQFLRAEQNTLLVFSDMLENTKKFSLYQCATGHKAIQDFREVRRGAKERPQFKNTAIELNLIPRYDLPRTVLQCRDHFWNWFFGDNDGSNATFQVDFLPGGDTK